MANNKAVVMWLVLQTSGLSNPIMIFDPKENKVYLSAFLVAYITNDLVRAIAVHFLPSYGYTWEAGRTLVKPFHFLIF